MKLRSCHIDNFGKLSDLHLDFSEGINVFHEPNAWGKSTLAAFLRVMFYGFDSKRESGLFDKERVVYRPWQGGTYGGELDFSYQGKEYRISRTFGKTEKTDAFHLYDLSTKLECHDFSSEIGKEIFGLDSSSFKRSAFIAQNDCECSSTDAINAKLGNLVENTNDINNFETAQKKIHDQMNRMSPSRATGSMKKRTNTITLLTEELRSFAAAEKSAKAISTKLAEKQAQGKELARIRDQYAKALQMASEESRRESMRQTYEALVQEENRKKEALESYRNVFPGEIPEDEEFAKQSQDVQMLGVLKTTLFNLGLTEEEEGRYHQLSERFANNMPSEEELTGQEREQERLAKLKEEKTQLETKLSYFEAMAMKREEPDVTVHKRIPMLIAGIVLLVLGGLGTALALLLPALQNVRIPVLAAAVALAAIGLVLIAVRNIRVSKEERRLRALRVQRMEEEQRLRGPVEEISKTMEEASKEAARIEACTKEFLEQYQMETGEKDARTCLYELRSQVQEYERLKSRAGKSEAARQEFDRKQSSLLEFGKEAGMDFGEDLAAGISQLQMKATEYRIARTAYREAKQARMQYEKEHNVQKITAVEKCPYTLDELNTMIHDVDARSEDIREAIEQYRHQMDDLQEQLDLRDEKEQQLAICRQEQKEEEERYEILQLTGEFLQSAKEQFSARYLGPIERGFGRYYTLLTGDENKDWMVDANIEVQMKEQGEMRQTKWLSAGYQDLLGVCMRLALVDAMYPEEKPFLLLDDPFVNLDEEKMEHGNELLGKIAQEYQVLYFTCHSSRNIHNI